MLVDPTFMEKINYINLAYIGTLKSLKGYILAF